MTLLFTLALIANAAGKAPRVTIHIEDNPVAIQCRIPLDESNRWVNIGVQGYFSSGQQLEGLPSDPVHVRRSVPPLACDGAERSAQAFCEIWWVPNGFQRVTAPVPCIP